MKARHSILFLFVFTFCGKIGGQAPYCASEAASDGISDITKVEIKLGASSIFVNNSTCGFIASGSGSIGGRYSNYSNLTINLVKSNTYTLEVTHHACGTNVNANTRMVMYLDLNKNYAFDTPSERFIWTTPTVVPIGSSIVFSGSFTIPSSLTIDSTRMRIITAATTGGLPTPCNTLYSRGETEDYTVTFCEPVNRSRTITQPLCFGQTNGKIKIAATGGRAPLQYAWNGGSYGSIDSLVNISAGTYTLITRDSIGCRYFDTMVVAQPSALNLSKQLTNSCQNLATGKIILTGSGGRPGYRYRLGTSGSYDTTRQYAGLGRGSYIVSVRDTNLCVRTDTVAIDSFPFYPLRKELDTIVCRSKGANIILRYQDIFDHTKHTHYSHNGDTFKPLFQGMYQSNYTSDSGRHIIIMRDLHGCLTADTTYLSAPPATQLSLVSMNHQGCNGKKGQIQVLRTGGNPALSYSYYWSHIGATTYKDSFQNLDTGLYRIEVRDDRGCDTHYLNIRIKNISARVTPSYQVLTTFKCPSDTQHIVKLSASGGTGPYQYSFFKLDYPEWDYKTYGFPPYSSKDTVHASSANAYKQIFIYLKVKDSNQCENDTSFYIKPESICYASPTILPNPSCAGDTIEIRMRYNGGDKQFVKNPVRYSLQGLPFTTDSILKPVKAIQGSNIITIQHGQGCVDYVDAFISTNPAVTITTIPISPSCVGQNNGSIRAFVLSGTSPYTYSLNGGAGQTSDLFTGLGAGSYAVKVVDDYGCKTTQQVVLNPLNYILKAELLQPISCQGAADGVLRVTLSGSSIQASVQYSLNGSSPSSQNTWGGLAAGSYTIRMLYNTSCSYDTTIVLTEPSRLRANYVANLTALPCYGSQLGSIQLAPTGGTLPYSLSLNGASIPVQNLNGLGAARYSLALMDSRGCIDSQTFVFNAPERLRIDTTLVIHPSCAAGTSGEIRLSTTGGTLPHTILWNTGETSLIRTGLLAGSYTISVTDNNACRDSIRIVLTEPSGIMIQSKVTDISCYGYRDGRIDIQTSGGTLPHTYLWQDGVQTASRTSLDIGTYTLTITDSRNCNRLEPYSISQPSKISSEIKVKDATCPYTTDGSIRITPAGGTVVTSMDYRISLNNAVATNKTIYEALEPKLYTLKIMDKRDCYLDTQAKVSSPLLVRIQLDSIHQLAKLGETLRLNPILEPSSAAVSLLWKPSHGLSCTDCLYPEFSGFITQKYTISYRYENNLCGDSVQTIIRVPLADPTTIYIPTAFSPNGAGDPENETFKVYGLHILDIDMKVFNRWGEKVFETKDKQQGWNGIYKGEAAPVGLYTYTLHIRLLDGTKLVKSGEVMLIR